MRSVFITIALYIALLPAAVSAQCPQKDLTKELAAKTPIGHYAKAVIERVDDGIALAKSKSGGDTVIDLLKYNWLYELQSIFFMLFDTELRSIQQSYDITSIPACLHADLAILEAKMEEIRCETNRAYENKSTGGIEVFKALTGFLNQSYKNILTGASNPEFEAIGWQDRYIFDEEFEGWCCVTSDMECQAMDSSDCPSSDMFYGTYNDCIVESTCGLGLNDPSKEPNFGVICPFDSDYLAPNTSGYGCDQTVLDDFDPPSGSSMETESEAMDDILEMRDEFLDDINHIKDAAEKMDDILENRLFTDREREHLEQFGTARLDEIQHKHVFGCDADVVDDDEVKPSRLWSSRALRGPFFYAKDHIGIWKAFYNLNHYWASEREYPDHLKNPDEFPEEGDREDRMKKDEQSNRFIVIPRTYIRDRWATFMHNQATEEAGMLPKAQDVQSAEIETIKPVRAQMKENIDLIKDKDGGLRKFVKNYAYFLRRSCIFRPCNTQLDQILKIVFSDECFPYTSGAFITGKNPNDNNAGSNTWDDCRKAVEKL
jgi:hypothetical protein